jgi:hypothetical protein
MLHIMSGMTSESLEEENRKLRLEVKQLLEELSLRDSLVATLEAQIKAIIKEYSGHTITDGSSVQQSTSQRARLPTRDNGKSSTVGVRSRTGSEDDDESAMPPLPMGSRRKLRDPQHISKVNLGGSPPTQKEGHIPDSPSPRLITRSDASENFAGTALPGVIVEGDEDVDSSEDNDGRYVGWNHGGARNEVISRKNLGKAQGTIKALPRELDIRNADDDDVTKYSLDDRIMPSYHLDGAEMRDAYNARGIYSGSVSRKHQVPHGKGIMSYHMQGKSYSGDWVMGHWHGQGRIRNANGDVYEGPVINDLRIGMSV